jgi:hypothetical protein
MEIFQVEKLGEKSQSKTQKNQKILEFYCPELPKNQNFRSQENKIVSKHFWTEPVPLKTDILLLNTVFDQKPQEKNSNMPKDNYH